MVVIMEEHDYSRFVERYPYHDFDGVKETTIYKTFVLGLRFEEFKTEMKNALPKWLKWIIK
jgi:hypothetical protein